MFGTVTEEDISWKTCGITFILASAHRALDHRASYAFNLPVQSPGSLKVGRGGGGWDSRKLRMVQVHEACLWNFMSNFYCSNFLVQRTGVRICHQKTEPLLVWEIQDFSKFVESQRFPESPNQICYCIIYCFGVGEADFSSSSRSSDGNSSLPIEGGSTLQVPRVSIELVGYGSVVWPDSLSETASLA